MKINHHRDLCDFNANNEGNHYGHKKAESMKQLKNFVTNVIVYFK